MGTEERGRLTGFLEEGTPGLALKDGAVVWVKEAGRTSRMLEAQV